MKIAVEKKELIQYIQHLASVVPTKNPSPILMNYLVKADETNNLIEITASDLEITAIVQFSATVHEGGAIAVSARHLNEIIASLPDQVINMYTEEELLKINCEKIDFSLMIADHTLFPVIPKVALDDAISISAELFQKMIVKTSFAVSTDVNRAVLTGVYWSIRDDHHLMAATDGRKVAEIKILNSNLRNQDRSTAEDNLFNQSLSETIDRVIPVKTLNFIQKIYNSNSKDLKIRIESSRIMFAYENYVIFTHIIEHKYPDYQKAFIKDLPNTIIIEKDRLKTAIRRVALVAPDDNLRIRFEIDLDHFEINTVNRDTGDAKQFMDNYSYQGNATSVSFNYKFILSILDAVDTDKVKISLGSSKDPLMVYNETSPEDQEITFLLMPLRS
ncbi:MAG: DNA polymerase III subunit beta [Candidatus Cloacimonetes bacterium]|nr:DNA polymerase III subunit beta [Candidatus Cloacimonadota bacterium]